MQAWRLAGWGGAAAALILAGWAGGCESHRGGQCVTEADNGAAVRLERGEELEICLTGNPTTGYRWEVGAYDAAVVARMEGPRYAADDSGGKVGTGGRYYTVFEAVQRGQTEIVMTYRQAGNADPGSVFRVVVSVE